MSFHSLDFVLFFVVCVAVYWQLSHAWQNRFLLAASYVFYGWIHPWFLILIAITTVVDYWAARGIDAQPERRRLFLGLSLAANLGMLGFFKYFNFFVENVSSALAAIGLHVGRPELAIVLPVGISFYTFQALTYTIGVYRRQVAARRRFIDVALFTAFFPQLVAGPIERASVLLPQIERERRFSIAHANEGLVLMLWGFFKKLVVADNVGVIANKVFSVQEPAFEVLWAGVFAFGIQIYADFSAYSDIARGSARWIGFDLIQNFDHPYLASGPSDFWRRWHISLSSWFRDYVYIPLGGSRVRLGGQIRNLLATFLLSGVWHGASWNYVIWGLYHGVLLSSARLLHRWPQPAFVRTPAIRILRIAGTFVLVNVGWLMFRETELSVLVRDFMRSPWRSSPLERQAGLYLFTLATIYSLPLWAHSLWVEWSRRRAPDKAKPAHASDNALRDAGWPPAWAPGAMAGYAVLMGLLAIGILVLRSRTSLDFIYFRF